MTIKNAIVKAAVVACTVALVGTAGCAGRADNQDGHAAMSNGSSDVTGGNGTNDATGITDENSINSATGIAEVELNDIYTQPESVVEHSLVATGHTGRMKRMLEKAARGEDITVAFIGGSITYGYKVKKEECFATLYTNWLSEKFGTSVRCVNAGISGTPSVLGNLRVEDEVLAEKPDLVVVEFAVNDGGETVYKNSYESMVSRILKADNEPAVMLLFTITENGHTCEEWMKTVGEHYSLPMVSVVSSMMEECKAGRISFKDYSGDGVHPNTQGHRWINEYLKYATWQIWEAESGQEEYVYPEKAAIARFYENMVLHTDDDAQIEDYGSWDKASPDSMKDFTDTFAHGWTYIPGKENEPLVIKANCRCILLIYKDVPGGDKNYGAIDVMVDGKVKKGVVAQSAGGWYEPTFSVIMEEVTAKEHEISIKMQDGFEDKQFEIMGIAWL
ncbi:MAG: SGNH/GDSL hydrolase family protein [Lachnospiraceae bacterium]|nr:SGNH/GDSL hydrolase family protein [Candidatus Merdinaster equi]